MMRVLALIAVWSFLAMAARGETFAAWAAGYGLTGTNAAPLADPDQDGLPNLVEYAFAGFDPSTPDGRPTTQFVAGTRATNTVTPDKDISVIVLTPDLKPPTDGSAFYLGLRYTPRTNAEGILYQPQYSPQGANIMMWLDGRSAFFAPTAPDTNGAVISWMRGMFEKDFKAAFLRMKLSTK